VSLAKITECKISKLLFKLFMFAPLSVIFRSHLVMSPLIPPATHPVYNSASQQISSKNSSSYYSSCP